jgi:CxxC motif-containing protein
VSERYHYLCIGCPLGCRLEVEEEAGAVVEVRGFACKRGQEFALQEHTDPRRVVTTTVRVTGGVWPRLPVKTAKAIPKAKVLPLCRALHALTLEAPVKLGQVVMADALGTGVDVVATRDLPKA